MAASCQVTNCQVFRLRCLRWTLKNREIMSRTTDGHHQARIEMDCNDKNSDDHINDIFSVQKLSCYILVLQGLIYCKL